jgi:hypothetical protein
MVNGQKEKTAAMEMNSGNRPKGLPLSNVKKHETFTLKTAGASTNVRAMITRLA